MYTNELIGVVYLSLNELKECKNSVEKVKV